MAANVKTALPSFSIFRKAKKPALSDNDSTYVFGSGLPAQNDQAKPSIIHSNTFSKTPSHSSWKEAGPALDLNSYATDITTLFPEQPFCRDITIAAGVGNALECSDHSTIESGMFSYGEHIYPTRSYVPTESNPPDLGNPEVLEAITGAQSAWATLSSVQELSDYDIHYSTPDTFSMSLNGPESYQTPQVKSHSEFHWPEEQTMTQQAYPVSITVPSSDSWVQPFHCQPDPAVCLYGPVGADLTTESLGQCSDFQSTHYIPASFPSAETHDKDRNSGFHEIDIYKMVNVLSYNHVESFVNAGQKRIEGDASNILVKKSTKCDSASLPSNQIAEGSEEIEMSETAGSSNYDDRHKLQEDDIAKKCDKEREEKEAAADLERVDDCTMDDDQKELGRQSNNKVESYLALISKAILDSPERKLPIFEIYAHIRKHNPGISISQKSWQNTVRHNLSLNECFVKQVRKGRGRGHYWMVHPACVDDFLKGNYQRRHARRRAKKCPLMTRETNFMVERPCEENIHHFDHVSELVPQGAETEMWDGGYHFSPEIQPTNASSTAVTDQSYFMASHLEDPSKEVDNIQDVGLPLVSDKVNVDSWFAGGEAATGSDWFEFPENW